MDSPSTWAVEDDEEMEEEEEEEGVSKKLLFDCAETPHKPELRRAASSKKQSVVVYLRVRPKSQREILSMDASCLHLLSQRELQAVAPATSQTFKNKAGARCPAESSQQFSFTHIFDEGASQREVFEEALIPTLRDFFAGQNCLVFTYGVTNSGKTYTVTGTSVEPGILPRSLDLVFNSIGPQQMSSLELRPKNFSEAIYLTEEEVASELTRRESILNKAREMSVCEESGVEETGDVTTDSTSNISTLSKVSSNYSKVSEPGASLCEIQVQDGSTIDLENNGDVCYSLWVSFAEIYNELIYDLLAEEPDKTRRGRPALRLAEDRNHNHFIKGLVEMRVENMEEALLLLRMGVQHRHVASTCLNYQSSRSHTIFTVKMIKVLAGPDRPHSAFVNRISIVDLAGAERSKETGARGMRMREAGNINNSLLTLGKCIEAMRHNQNRRRGEEHILPFRESKLTRLFQNYFVGKGKGVRQGRITMLVNVSNNASVFDETSHVLKFSALTSKIVPIVKEIPAQPHSRPRPLPSARVLRSTAARDSVPPATPLPGKSTRCNDDRTIEAKRTVTITVCEHCEAKREALLRLRGRVSALEVEKMESEYQIRQEVCREFQEQLTDIEEAHREELVEQAEEMQELYDKRMEILQKSMKKQFNRKRRRVEEEEEEGGGVEEARLREKVAQLMEELRTERERNAALSAELKDTAETHEARVTRLNQQVNSASLRASQAEGQVRGVQEELATMKRDAEDRESELVSIQETLKGELSVVRNELARAARENTELEIKLDMLHRELESEQTRANMEAEQVRERERDSEESCRALQLQVEETNARLLEKKAENEALASDRLFLISEYEAREGQLRDEISSLKSELAQRSEAASASTARVERETEERVCEAEAGREDAMAEVEILQARISELTREAELTAAGSVVSSSSVSEADLTSLRETVGDLEVQLEQREREMVSLRETNLATLQTAQRENSSLRDQLAELETRLAEGERLVASLRAAEAAVAVELRARVGCLLQEVVSMRTDLGTSRQELVEGCGVQTQQLWKLLDVVAGERESLQQEVNELRSQLGVDKEEVEGLKSRLCEQESSSELRVAALEKEKSGLAGEMSQLERAQQEKDQELSDLKRALQEEIGGLRTANSAAQEEKDQQLSDLRQAHQERERELDELRTSHSLAEQEKEILGQQLAGLRADQEEKELQLKGVQREKMVLEEDLAELRAANSAQLEKADLRAASSAAQLEKEQEITGLRAANSAAQLEKEQEITDLRAALTAAQLEKEQEITDLRAANSAAQLEKEQEITDLRAANSAAQLEKEQEITDLRAANSAVQLEKEQEITDLRAALSAVQLEKEQDITDLRAANSAAQLEKEQEITDLRTALSAVQLENEQEITDLRAANSAVQLEKEQEITDLRAASSAAQLEKEQEITDLRAALSAAQLEKEQEITGLRAALSAIQLEKEQEITDLRAANSAAQLEKELEITDLRAANSAVQLEKEQEITDLRAANSAAQLEKEQEITGLRAANSAAQLEKEQEITGLRAALSAVQLEKLALEQQLTDLQRVKQEIEEQELTDLRIRQQEKLAGLGKVQREVKEELIEEMEPQEEKPLLMMTEYATDFSSERPLSPSAAATSGGLPRSDSKPYVPILERSSQLVEDSFSEVKPRVVIDATPPIARKKRGREKKQKPAEKDVVATEGDTPTKRGKYQLRNRSKHQRFVADENSMMKSLMTRVRPNKKVLEASQPSPPLPPPAQPGATRTTRRTKAITKSQISAPLGLLAVSPRVPLNNNCADIGPGAPPLYYDH